MASPRLRFFKRPNALPDLPSSGRLVMLDVAFAAWGDYDRVTRPFIRAAGDRLRGWIDHHRHPAWPDFADDARFVLVPRKEAPGCPQLVTEARVAAAGPIEHLWAHADFDGCLSAARFLNQGKSCYPEMDEDARAMDSPGWGFSCSDRGLRLNRAMEAMEDAEYGYEELLEAIATSLVAGEEDAPLKKRLDKLEKQRIEHEADLMPLIDQAERPHPEVLLLEVDWLLGSANKKMLLRAMEYKATVAMIREPGNTTIATYHSEQGPGLKLNSLDGLRGPEGYAFGSPKPAKLLPEVVRLIEAYRAGQK